MRGIALSLLLFCTVAAAQDGFVADWFQRSDRAKADQPHWMTPVATVTPRLEQEFRTDFNVQPTAAGDTLVNFGGGKGLELIPQEHIELLLNVPPYLEHNSPRIHDGFGDVSFVAKYRLAARTEENGNYIVTVFLGGTVPTGSYTNGARAAVITPTLAAGKGWGRFDVQSTLGVGMPVSYADAIGHAIAFNTALQYHYGRKFWPELEVNSTSWTGGTLDGKTQTFLTPGLILGRFHLYRRLATAMGVGYQVAVTHYHMYNHAFIFTVRFPF
jgi:hypothetical protein